MNPFSLAAVTGLQWLTNPADGDNVFACVGQNVTLPLDFSTDNGEEILVVRWLFGGNVLFVLPYIKLVFQISIHSRIHKQAYTYTHMHI